MNTKIEAPWYTYNKKVKALFANDPQIEVGDIVKTDDGVYELGINVKSHKKYNAMLYLMPDVVSFGNVKVKITIYDMENDLGEDYDYQMIKNLFWDNPNVKSIETVKDPTGTPHYFVMFQPEVIQFFDDNLFDANGLWTGLAQDIAKEVLNVNPGVHFCTAKK